MILTENCLALEYNVFLEHHLPGHEDQQKEGKEKEGSDLIVPGLSLGDELSLQLLL